MELPWWHGIGLWWSSTSACQVRPVGVSRRSILYRAALFFGGQSRESKSLAPVRLLFGRPSLTPYQRQTTLVWALESLLCSARLLLVEYGKLAFESVSCRYGRGPQKRWEAAK